MPVTEMTATSTNWETENNALDRRFLEAMAAKDVDAAMSCFLASPDLIVVLWGKEMRGPAQVRAALNQLFDNYDQVKLDIDRVVELSCGECVIAVGQATYTLSKHGKQSKVTELWTDVRRKVNGEWVYALDHAEVVPEK